MTSCNGCGHRNTPTCKGCVGRNRYKSTSTSPIPHVDISKEMEMLAKYALNDVFGVKNAERKNNMRIKKVIFNDPATVVLWEDGTKTIVKSGDDDIYDPEKGLAIAIAKKALGNKGNYYNVFKKWLPEYKHNDFDLPVPIDTPLSGDFDGDPFNNISIPEYVRRKTEAFFGTHRR